MLDQVQRSFNDFRLVRLLAALIALRTYKFAINHLVRMTIAAAFRILVLRINFTDAVNELDQRTVCTEKSTLPEVAQKMTMLRDASMLLTDVVE